MENNKRFETKTLREYPKVGPYRVRLLSRPDGGAALDIREWLETENFSGFTRRGIRITHRRDVASLRETLTQLLEDDAVNAAEGGEDGLNNDEVQP